MRVIICGSRLSEQRDQIFKRLDDFHGKTPITLVVEGGQRKKDRGGKIIGGVDYWAQQWARRNRIPCSTCNAHWKQYGKGAGPIRNLEMIVKYKPETVIAFPGGTGTENMVYQAKQHKIPVVRLA